MKRNIEELDCAALKERVGSRLLDVGAPLAACLAGQDEQQSAEALASLRNPYAIEDDPGAFHTTGWHGAHVSGHSPRTVAAESAADIAAAVDFAREHGAGLVIKGTGHDCLRSVVRPRLADDLDAPDARGDGPRRLRTGRIARE